MNLKEVKALFHDNLAVNYPDEWNAFFKMSIFEVDQYTIKDIVFNRFTSNKEVYQAIVQRLKNHEPIQYILGSTYFMDLKLVVNNTVLIPRPETEELVWWITEKLGRDFEESILDIGTGSGCIAIGLKKLMPSAQISALDISQEALFCANKNAEKHDLKINFKEIDILNQSLPLAKVWVSNPPYIGEEESAEMRPNVLMFEPHIALFSKGDVLIFYKVILNQARELKVSQVFFEINPIYVTEIIELGINEGYDFEVKKDFYGKDRMLHFFL